MLISYPTVSGFTASTKEFLFKMLHVVRIMIFMYLKLLFVFPEVSVNFSGDLFAHFSFLITQRISVLCNIFKFFAVRNIF